VSTVATLPDMTGAYISSGEAARQIGVHLVTLQRWVKAGYVTPAGRTAGGHYRWDLDDLRRQLAERKTVNDTPGQTR
jgi:excisionase family DNA binding protein